MGGAVRGEGGQRQVGRGDGMLWCYWCPWKGLRSAGVGESLTMAQVERMSDRK